MAHRRNAHLNLTNDNNNRPNRPITPAEREYYLASLIRLPESERPQIINALEVGTIGAIRTAMNAILNRARQNTQQARNLVQQQRQIREDLRRRAMVIPTINNFTPGIAFEIHEEFKNLKFDKFINIIRTVIGRENNFKNRNYPLNPLIANINNNININTERKTNLIEKLNRIHEIFIYYENFRKILPYILDAIQYILMQPQEVIDAYIETFTTDCLKAYATGSGESCIRGMVERVFMSYRDTMSTICLDQIQGVITSPLCKQEYLDILNCFLLSKNELNDYFKDWHSEYSEEAANWTKIKRIENFINFVRIKLNNSIRFADSETLIRDYAITNINVLFGGMKRQNNKNKNTKKQLYNSTKFNKTNKRKNKKYKT